ncbi:MAG: 23S rRNA (pseudouridine(1915)-N(3))-methyltransferase RlmH [Deltaproteobacteria bacterium]|nr:23S rRNA (pseudouridine(1915)-N(3))-methyltransferase RlmH [Deltaproteobacteria bacterium]
MKLKLLAVGKIKKEAFQNLAKEYQRRIQHFHPFEVVEIPDEKIASKNEVPRVLEKEAERIEKHLKKGAFLVVLDEKGEQWTSVDLAFELGELFQKPVGEIVFLIGGAFGIAESVKEKAGRCLSLSKLTLPHQLARVLTLEQLYRALTILKNVPYHHE